MLPLDLNVVDAVEAEGDVRFGAETVGGEVIEGAALCQAEGLDFAPSGLAAAEWLVLDVQGGVVPDGFLNEIYGFW